MTTIKAQFGDMAQSMHDCMSIAKYLDLNPTTPVPVGTPESDFDDARARYRLSKKHVVHMLNATAFEIAIKLLYKMDTGGDHPHNHNIHRMYRDLSDTSKSQVAKIYKQSVSELAAIEGDGNDGHLTLGELVQFQSLDEALKSNEDVMKNFKYDGAYKGKSSAMGSAIWNGETLWAFPPMPSSTFFPERLCNYVLHRMEIGTAAN